MSETKLKLGSLFSGIGGFELVGSWYNIEPVWASEIERQCIRITEKHFPNMKHLGDITKIHGDEIEPVDIITGGSPCQDLSHAGKQAGIKLQCAECGTTVDFKENTTICPNCGSELDSTRSGLFMEQIRIIREMREKTNECFPKIVIGENVLGALNSNNGEDFYCVLEKFCGLVGSKLPKLRPEKWSKCGEILGDNFSIAWRLFDAQYWGVPQRRRRIYLVADFRGQRAKEILFKPESLRRHFKSCKEPWESFTDKTKSSIRESGNDRTTAGRNHVMSTLTSGYGRGYNVNAGAYNGDQFVFDNLTDTTICVATHQVNAEIMVDKCPTLTAANGMSGSNKPYVVLLILTDRSNTEVTENITPPLVARDYKSPLVAYKSHSIVRRLTPLECERLQGFPDGWTESESDSARYKAIGNSVALPCVDYIMSGVADVLDP